MGVAGNSGREPDQLERKRDAPGPRRRRRSGGSSCSILPKPTATRLYRPHRCHLRPNHRFSANVPTIFKSWEIADKGQTPPGYLPTRKERPPRGGERWSQISFCRHFPASQRVPTATGQNGAAQPPPRARQRDVVCARDRELLARRRELTSLWCDANSIYLGSRAVQKLSGSGAELQES